MWADISNLYLNNTMDIYKYMKVPLENIPGKIIQQ